MNEGEYDVLFSAEGVSRPGHARVEDSVLVGADGVYHFRGQLEGTSAHVEAEVAINVVPGVVHNSRIGTDFTMRMSGAATPSGFRLLGAGPLGLIIEIDCRRSDPAPR